MSESKTQLKFDPRYVQEYLLDESEIATRLLSSLYVSGRILLRDYARLAEEQIPACVAKLWVISTYIMSSCTDPTVAKARLHYMSLPVHWPATLHCSPPSWTWGISYNRGTHQRRPEVFRYWVLFCARYPPAGLRWSLDNQLHRRRHRTRSPFSKLRILPRQRNSWCQTVCGGHVRQR